MFGAIVGDVIGSRFERYNYKGKDFQMFHESCKMTDDSILTIAVADAYLNKKDYAQTLVEYARENPLAGYGGSFIAWVDSEDHAPYNSWGNGSAMRISALPWLINDYTTLMKEVEKSAACTHNHPEGIRGAQAIASAIWFAIKEFSKEEIKQNIIDNFGYNLDRTVQSLVETYEFDVSCQGSCPEAIICFLESTDFEDCIRTAISIGGDSDTIASMSGAIAAAYYSKRKLISQNYISEELEEYVLNHIASNKKYDKVFKHFEIEARRQERKDRREEIDIFNQYYKEDNFMYTEDVLDNKPDSEYFIMCANINSDDTWVWKFCVHEHNFTPVWSSEYGDCRIKGEDLTDAMKYANEWINGTKHPLKKIHPSLFLMKIK